MDIPINIFVISMIIYGAVFAFFVSWIVFIIREEFKFRDDWFFLKMRWAMDDSKKEYADFVQGKDYTNPLIIDSLIKKVGEL